jgi:hypothetical protein
MRRVPAAAPYPGPVLRSRCLGVIAAFLPAAVLLTGCGRAVVVQPLPIGAETARTACATVIDALPDTLSAGRSWRVQPDPSSTAAWGSPPVVLRCGDGVRGRQPTDQLLTVAGITWVVEVRTDGEEYRTVGRSPGIVVAVPDLYAPTAAVLAEVTPAVASGTGPTDQG